MSKHAPDTITYTPATERDRERIDACLLACAGVPTSVLKEGAVKELIEAAALARDRGDNIAHKRLCSIVAKFIKEA